MRREWYRLVRVVAVGLALTMCALAQIRPSTQSVDGNPHRSGAQAAENSSATQALAPARDGGIVTSDTVLTIVKPSGDATRVVEYTPAAGISADLLAAHLGVDHHDIDDGSTNVAPAAYGQCSYAYLGTAKTLCPMLHWTNAGHAQPQVYYVDHTGGVWPVQQSTLAWNSARNIQLHYTRVGCPAGAHCVNVWDANYGNSCWQGMTTWSYDRYGNFIDNSVDIRLNDYNGTGVCQGRSVNYYKNSAGYRQNICHEQGHTLGLDHNAAYDSCLYASVADRTTLIAPDSDDLTLLGWLYSTTH